ncbi:uncharacterized protein TRIREDRAFT_104927 [Trichoderma reesei QM6a]|uniref:Predicted protein n=2 Tax=Hypocrea jecorina TaxID=51453 RepID=G0RCY6_HYPJQ|nr:uncharacterized protein TRIREDRAFT_104927 [Trichoderma reesei QM6a]EGR50884.1 predicted protein [Trichoderma reesei QM6a]ETS05602.1 hypothetical protein M419DRAFT_72211 [Trichoderma reesei RUT C-30]
MLMLLMLLLLMLLLLMLSRRQPVKAICQPLRQPATSSPGHTAASRNAPIHQCAESPPPRAKVYKHDDRYIHDIDIAAKARG